MTSTSKNVPILWPISATVVMPQMATMLMTTAILAVAWDDNDDTRLVFLEPSLCLVRNDLRSITPCHQGYQ